jgi:uroporphyrin-III C-methyltransferase/precorrin-2 dehydrogenase/sirohydrochlorin ferrochelatase
MDYLPLFVEVRDRPCLLVGGGEVAARKLDLLLRAGALVEIVSPELGAATRQLVAAHGIAVQARRFEPADVQGRYLIIAATDDPAVNRQVFELGSAVHTLVNSVDQPEISSTIFPAIVDRSPVIVAISTGGGSPTLARTVRGWLEARLPARLGALAAFIAERRRLVQARLDSIPARQRLWEQFIAGGAAERLYQGDASAAQVAFDALLAAQEQPGESGRLGGFVALIGAGPGDPELLTLKALRLLQSADVVLYDNLVDRRILDYARRDAERIYVGKRRRDHGVGQQGINELLVEQARAGRNVVRLKGGDPFIFGRGGEETEALAAAGFDCIIVPGITAAMGAASYAGIPLTHRDLAQSVRFVTGHRVDDRINLDWPELAKPGQTLVIYMGRGGLAEILAGLVAHGMAPDMPAALVANATLEDQRVVQGTVSDLAARVAASGVTGPTITLVGEVVALRRPLSGEKPG